MNIDKLFTNNGVFYNMSKDWLLRFECSSFLILVNKKTNQYVNLYENDFKTKGMLKIFVDIMDKHEKFMV